MIQRPPNPRTQKLWEAIYLTLNILKQNGNQCRTTQLLPLTRQIGIHSIPDLSYIINNAVSEGLLLYDLRSGTVTRTEKDILFRLIQSQAYKTFDVPASNLFKQELKQHFAKKYNLTVHSNSLEQLVSIYTNTEK